MQMEKEPLFSVLIACYNREKYIEETIESIFNQTYSNWEIIIVDDASTDKSRAILKKLSSGETFGVVDPDDTLKSTAIEKMVKQHSEYPQAALIYSQLYYCNEKLEPIKVPEYNCQIPEDTTFLEYRKGPSAFATVKREYYNLTEGIDPFLKISEDTDMYLKLEEVGDLVFYPEPLYYYRNNPGSISLNKNVHVWRAIVIASACKRRGLDREDLIINYFVEKDRKWQERQDETRETLQFRLGHFILWPLIKLRELIRK